MQVDHQRALEQLREDMIGRYYATLEENNSSAPSAQNPSQLGPSYSAGTSGKRFE